MNTTPFKRRDFLKTTAAAAAILPTFNVLSQRRVDTLGPDDDPVSVAVIGYGQQGELLADAAMKIPGVRIKAVCDIWFYRQRLANGRLKALGHPVNVYEDYRELLEKEDARIDAVLVASPDWMHAEHTCACLCAGKHVYCETAMSNRLEHAWRMVLAQRETGRMLQIGHQRRSNPRYMHAINRIARESGLLGRVTHAYAQWHRSPERFLSMGNRVNIPIETLQKYGYESMEQFTNWRWFEKYGGGPMLDLGSGQIDLFFWLWNCQPVSVTAIGGNDYHNRQTNDNVMAMYEFRTKEGNINRAYYQMLSTSCFGRYYEQFMGEDGTLVISEASHYGNAVWQTVRSGGPNMMEWEALAKTGLAIQAQKPVPRERGYEGVYAVRMDPSDEPIHWSLPIELLKPRHMPHLENFFYAVRRNAPELLNSPAEQAYPVAVAVLAANRAVAERRTITFKPEDFKV
ncbi:MAG: Gfo/Idh/MocA family oxidoreductase [Verrucomicrobiota bacterium]|jgi:predicted dehydrogenase|nr:Gfo/Idh/MocA family oxidoreductase [Verrucomicrobiota bacterium]